ncbi:MAG: histidine kinase [Rhodothermales bacterium]
MKRFIQIAPFFVILVPLLVLIPAGKVAWEWIQLARIVPLEGPGASERGFDWVSWQDVDGGIVATFVAPKGPAARGGIAENDIFFSLDQQVYFNAEDLKEAVNGIPPGSTRSYVVLRGEEQQVIEARVRVTRYPAFLYPLSASLWQFSIWSFALAAFFHVLGLLIVAPLAIRNRKAKRAQLSLLLILTSSFWIFGNWVRLLLVETVGPAEITGSAYDLVFQMLTVLSILGWIIFPALLLRKVLGDTHLIGAGRLGRIRHLIYVPTVIFGLAALIATVKGNLGPFSLDSLIAPLLLYASCYVALAAALVLALYAIRGDEAEDMVGGWSRIGSALTLLFAVSMALLVLGVLPLFGSAPDVTAGWLIVSAQLLSLGPMILVSLATLKQGKIDKVLNRALTYLTLLGVIFFAFLGGMEIMERYVDDFVVSQKVLAGIYVILLLFVFERIVQRVRSYAPRFFTTERQILRQTLSQYQRQMGTIVDLYSLAQQTVQTVGEAFDTRWCVFFIRPDDSATEWVSAAYHPQPPYVTERMASSIWPVFEEEGKIWAVMPELNESALSTDAHQMLKDRGAALAIPIGEAGRLEGLLLIGGRARRRSVFNLEDLELLRGLSGQLALAIERLLLVEREKTLIRVSAEAELKALRAQINPHFLFNALNTIIALIEERPEEAEATVQHLASIFRHILNTSSRPYVTLDEERRLVNHYLSIEKARFGDQLDVHIDIPPQYGMHPVPAFALQTIVENAVKHGLEKKRGVGYLRIAGRQFGTDGVELVISDTGVGIEDLFDATEEVSRAAFFGIGLQNIATRLEKLYGETDLLQIRSKPDSGTHVTLRLPRPRAAVDADALFPAAASP